MSDEKELLRQQLKAVKTENEDLKRKLSELEKGFLTKIEPDSFIKSIQADLIKANDFALKQKRPTTYIVSELNLQVKAVITRQHDRLVFVLPSRPTEIDPNLMSVANLTMKPIPLAVTPVTKPRPVEAVEGIGPELAEKLREIGVGTVTDLALSSVADLKKINIPEKRAWKLIGMAKLMVKSELSGIDGVDEQAAELLTVAGEIDSKEKLAESDPGELFKRLRAAVEKGSVKVPKEYEFTIDDVKEWVESAKAVQ